MLLRPDKCNLATAVFIVLQNKLLFKTKRRESKSQNLETDKLIFWKQFLSFQSIMYEQQNVKTGQTPNRSL